MDRNPLYGDVTAVTVRRSLRGNVDRNYKNMAIILKQVQVVPYVGTWIEIVNADRLHFSAKQVVPYVGTWIEILILCYKDAVMNVVPYVGTWIEIPNMARMTVKC